MLPASRGWGKEVASALQIHNPLADPGNNVHVDAIRIAMLIGEGAGGPCGGCGWVVSE